MWQVRFRLFGWEHTDRSTFDLEGDAREFFESILAAHRHRQILFAHLEELDGENWVRREMWDS